MINLTRVTSLIISILCFGFLFSKTVSFPSIILFLVFILASALAILLPTNIKIKYVNKSLTSLVIWLFSILSVGTVFYIYAKLNNLAPILFSTEYYWEEGVNIDFRTNGTYKAMNFSIMEGSVSYGKYELQDSLIILIDKIKFGNSDLKDTLIARKNGLHFSLEEPWRIEEGTMAYKYGPKATFKVLNKTDGVVDSLNVKLSYTEENINYQSLQPGQSIDYVFDMKNPYVSGEYYLTFNTIYKDINKKKFIDITNGYPLETVQSISLFDDRIVVELIFGKSITTALFVK